MQDLLHFEYLTDRLRLNSIRRSDAEEIFSHFTPEVTTYMYPAAHKEIRDSYRFIAIARSLMKAGKDVHTTIRRLDNHEFLGCAGIHRLEADHPELGIWLKMSVHGQGYGKEVIHGLKAWIDSWREYKALVYPVDERNVASRRIPEGLGGEVRRRFEKRNQAGKLLKVLEFYIPQNA